MEVDLNRLEIFREVVLAGSFSKAALRLHQPKSRISRNIAALEREMGVSLIYRTTRQFQLTQAGSELFRGTSPLLHEVKEIVARMTEGSDELTGSLKVTVPEDIGVELMGALCQEFRRLHPKVHIELHVTNRVVDLVRDSVDIAIRVGPSSDSSMIQKRIGAAKLILVMGPGFRERHGGVVRLDDLESLPYLAFTPLNVRGPNLKLFSGRESRTFKLKPSFSSNNFFVLKSMAMQNAGFTVMPGFLAQEPIREGRLVHLLKDWSPEVVDVKALMPQQKEVPMKVRKFIDLMVERLSVQLGH